MAAGSAWAPGLLLGCAGLFSALSELELRRAPGGRGTFSADSEGRVAGIAERLKEPVKPVLPRTRLACVPAGEEAGVVEGVAGAGLSFGAAAGASLSLRGCVPSTRIFAWQRLHGISTIFPATRC